MPKHDDVTWCPSSPPDRPEAVVLGVHDGSGALTYMDSPVPAREVLDLVPPGVEPTRVLRFASPCEAACWHRIGGACGLASKVTAAAVPVESAGLPRCHLRSRCTWWAQAGADACHRCPLIRTAGYDDDMRMRLISDPNIDLDQLAVALAAGDDDTPSV